ncbi:hypothetical protein NMY22_g11138 [Coprinellus aureogranulatus]|nr:hypothetical protein NMY22_g11138 [Coprinellus aureogranulatus]
MQVSSAEQYFSFTYPESTSPASTCGASSSSSVSSVPTPPPPFTPEPRPYRDIDLNVLKVHDVSAFPPLTTTKPLGDVGRFGDASTSRKASARIQIAHPYSRMHAKKGEVKRRKIWNHALEKHIFSPFEISTIGAPIRRTIYTASLEAHIDDLHAQLLELGFYPIPFHELEPYKGLNSKTAKSMVASLQHDASVLNLKLLELNRANKELQDILQTNP